LRLDHLTFVLLSSCDLDIENNADFVIDRRVQHLHKLAERDRGASRLPFRKRRNYDLAISVRIDRECELFLSAAAVALTSNFHARRRL
jgi:hypothetical protein